MLVSLTVGTGLKLTYPDDQVRYTYAFDASAVYRGRDPLRQLQESAGEMRLKFITSETKG